MGNSTPTLRFFLPAAALYLCGCAPVFESVGIEHSREGLEKVVTAKVHSYWCGSDGMSAKYRLQGSPTWTTGSPVLRSGSTGRGATAVWAMTIPGSDVYRLGDNIQTLWDASWNSGGWFCPEETSHVTQNATGAVSRAFGVSVASSPVEVSRGSSKTVTVSIARYDGFSAAVTVSLGGLPSGVTSTPSSVSTSSSSATFNLAATPTADPVSATVTASASSSPYTGSSVDFVVNAARPSISTLSPSVAPRGATVVVAGSSFHSVCSLNQVRIGSVVAVPTSCSASSLTITVPASASYGSATVTVEAGGLTSNGSTFVVARDAGSFTEFTYDVQGETSSGRVCGTGAVRLDITGAFTASYKQVSSGSQIGSSVGFQQSTGIMHTPGSDTPVSEPSLGGAGFSLCNTGVVLDANAITWAPKQIAVRFLRLDTGGSWFNVFVNYFSKLDGVNLSSGSPRLHRSPDGTVFAIVSPSETTADSRVMLLDRESGSVFATIEVTGVVSGMTARVTSDNKVIVTKGGTSFPAVTIP